MTLHKAIKILTEFQLWRLGDDNIAMLPPSDVTDALKIVLRHHKKDHIVDTNKMIKNSDKSILSVMRDYETTRCSILLNELFKNNIITESQKNESIKYMEKKLLESLKQPKK